MLLELKNEKRAARLAPRHFLEWLDGHARLKALQNLLSRLHLATPRPVGSTEDIAAVIHGLALAEEDANRACEAIALIEARHKEAKARKRLRRAANPGSIPAGRPDAPADLLIGNQQSTTHEA